MNKEDQPANCRRYYLLDKGATWKDLLRGKMIIEHPTIQVVFPGGGEKISNGRRGLGDCWDSLVTSNGAASSKVYLLCAYRVT